RAAGRPAAGRWPWTLAGWIHLVREIVTDLDDAPGDRALGRRTLPIALAPRRAELVAAALAGLFVPLSLVLPALAHYRAAYFLVALFAQVAVVLVATRLIAGRARRHALLLRGAMLVGLVADVAGRRAGRWGRGCSWDWSRAWGRVSSSPGSGIGPRVGWGGAHGPSRPSRAPSASASRRRSRRCFVASPDPAPQSAPRCGVVSPRPRRPSSASCSQYP